MQNCRRKAPDKIVYTDRQTEGQTAMAIPVYPLHFIVGGIMTKIFRLVQIENICRQLYECDSNTESW